MNKKIEFRNTAGKLLGTVQNGIVRNTAGNPLGITRAGVTRNMAGKLLMKGENPGLFIPRK